MPNKIPFEERIPIIETEIAKRRRKWTLNQIDFEDVSQMLMIRIFNKYHTFDEEKGVFSHWVNTVITRAIWTILRDNYTKFARPCVFKCVYNVGADNCSYTPSGKQCEECPLYDAWTKKKRDHHNVKLPVTLDKYDVDSENLVDGFLDIEGAKGVIDNKIESKLKPSEWKVYDLLFIQNKDDEEVAEILGYKTSPGQRCKQIQNIKRTIVAKAREIIDEENLA